MIKLGDKVRFVNEHLEGIVTRIDGKSAGVTIEDDFEIPVLLSEVVKISTVESNSTDKKEAKVTNKPQFVKVYSGYHIAFERFGEFDLELKFHNSESDFAGLAYYENNRLVEMFSVEQENNITLGKFKLNDFNAWPEFRFIITPIQQKFSNQQQPLVERSIKFNAKNFHAGFEQCYFLGKQAYTFRLDDEITSDALKALKEKDFGVSVTEIKAPDFSFEKNVLDIHADKLGINKSLTANEILDTQLKTANQFIETALVKGWKEITIIHGVGNLYLKRKLHEQLKSRKESIKNFSDADPLIYGGGATVISLRQ